MATKRDTFWKYAPLWATLFATGSTLAKTLGTRYILNRQWTFQRSDAATALAGAVLGYVVFRMRHGNEKEGFATR